MTKNTSKFIFGSFFLILGILVLMIKFDLVHLSFWKSVDIFWPVGLILAGILLMFRKRAIASLFVFITIVLGLVANIYVFESNALDELLVVNQKEVFDNSTLKVNYDVDFGAGELNIYSGFNYELYNIDSSSFYLDRKVEIKSESGENTHYVDFDRNDEIAFESFGEFFSFNKHTENWDLFLNPSVPIELDMDFGATDAKIDLSELMVEDLDLDFGASSVKLIFSNYPSVVDIDMGASDLSLHFPKGVQVLIEVDGGLLSTSLSEFKKTGDVYLTEDFKYNESYINISIDGGASNIEAEFY
jgi:hypothetical protein